MTNLVLKNKRAGGGDASVRVYSVDKANGNVTTTNQEAQLVPNLLVGVKVYNDEVPDVTGIVSTTTNLEGNVQRQDILVELYRDVTLLGGDISDTSGNILIEVNQENLPLVNGEILKLKITDIDSKVKEMNYTVVL